MSEYRKVRKSLHGVTVTVVAQDEGRLPGWLNIDEIVFAAIDEYREQRDQAWLQKEANEREHPVAE